MISYHVGQLLIDTLIADRLKRTADQPFAEADHGLPVHNFGGQQEQPDSPREGG